MASRDRKPTKRNLTRREKAGKRQAGQETTDKIRMNDENSQSLVYRIFGIGGRR
jgi:hypothetical protein